MSLYDDSLRLSFMALRDGLETSFITGGLMFRESVVQMVPSTGVTGKDEAAGIPGTVTSSTIELVPRPKLDMTQQVEWFNGVPTVVGDAKMTVSRVFTEAQLKGAQCFLIDGIRFTLEAGGAGLGKGVLKRSADGLDWIVVLHRDRQ
jgi:hypothetical protein